MICTRATAESMAYDDAFAAAPHVELHHPGLPALRRLRRGRASPAATSCSAVAHEYLDPLIAAGVDTLILGCTHYPLLTGVISYVMGDDVTLVSSAEECAKDVYKMLVRTGLMRDRAATRRTPSSPPAARTSSRPIGRRFLGPELVGRLPVRRWALAMRLD